MATAVDYWEKLAKPRFLLAPMMDQSELPFRMLCRRYGATAAYTPMLHSRIFVEDKKYRSSEFTTCPEDRPLLVQFCGNDPDTLLEAAKLVEPFCDYIDINLGCPQRVAKRPGITQDQDIPRVEQDLGLFEDARECRLLALGCSLKNQRTEALGRGQSGLGGNTRGQV